MLDDNAGRQLEGLDALPCSIGIGDIVVRQLLALELNVAGKARPARAQIRDRMPPADGGFRRSANPGRF